MSIKRVLIGNRGEIAIRVAKAVNELGYISVGLWTDSEPHAPHLAYCKEWVKLEGKSNRETYLNIKQILQICKQYRIDGVHPGYGFLSENAEFSQTLADNNIVFIGPNPRAVQMLGDKAASKKLARDANVPTVPGSIGEVPSIPEAIQIAKEIGYPVLLKAVAGGGGKGMRVCNNEEEIRSFFPAVQREAQSSFANPALLVEKYIVNPHHIEVQIIADKKGNVFHCFERECSIQRRHQKIIEEAPSPFIGDDEKLREQICKTAVTLAQAVNYDSAGTVEFIMGEDRKFYFLEMNTRIQVEHPITEETTGIDLVVSMIQAAFQDDFGIQKQSDIKRMGHAIECRICAEDPITMLPSPGVVHTLSMSFPQGTRFDHCLYPGLVITPDFDPMVGKLIVRGKDRKVCLRKMRSALEGLQIYGLKNNIPLLKSILKNDSFIEGHYTTKFIESEHPQNKIDMEDFSSELMKTAALIEFGIMSRD